MAYSGQMRLQYGTCDACQTAGATVETDAGFFLCEDCEGDVIVTFTEFELPFHISTGHICPEEQKAARYRARLVQVGKTDLGGSH